MMAQIVNAGAAAMPMKRLRGPQADVFANQREVIPHTAISQSPAML
jgi:hypothetical protein